MQLKIVCYAIITGHSKAVRDISFNNTGTQFLSAAYDRYVKLWDTETGLEILASYLYQCVSLMPPFSFEEVMHNVKYCYN